MYLYRKIFLVVALLLTTAVFASAKTIYVDQNAMGANNGTSWADAFTDLPTAMSNAVSGDEVWVTNDTYVISDTLPVASGISLIGGFEGTETTKEERAYLSYTTVTFGSVLQKFVISGEGYSENIRAVATTDDNYSGGGFANGVQRNCIAEDSTGKDGYGFYSSIAINSLARGMWYGFEESTAYNCVAYGNVFGFKSSTVYNSIAYENGSHGFYYSTAYNSNDKIGGVVLTDPANGDFSNAMTSNGIDAGMEYPEYGILNSNEPEGSAGVNIGLYGGTPLAQNIKASDTYDAYTKMPVGTVLYVDQNATGSADGTSWTNAFTTIQDAIAKAKSLKSQEDYIINNKQVEIWITNDTYVISDTLPVASGISLIGGFEGTETTKEERAYLSYTTVTFGSVLQKYVISGEGYSENIRAVATTNNNTSGGGFNNGVQKNCIAENSTTGRYGFGFFSSVAINSLARGMYSGFLRSTAYNCVAYGNANGFDSSTVYNSIASGNSSDGFYYSTAYNSNDKIGGVVLADPANGDFSNAMTSNGIDAGMEYPEYGILNSNEPEGSAGVNIGMYGGTPLAKNKAANAYDAYTKMPVGAVLYVDQNATGSADGTSWTNAFTTIEDAIAKAKSLKFTDDYFNKQVEIWITNDTYVISDTLPVASDISLIGGFEGTETTKEERAYLSYTTVTFGSVSEKYVISGEGYSENIRAVATTNQAHSGGGFNNGVQKNCIAENSTGKYGYGFYSSIAINSLARGMYSGFRESTAYNCVAYGNDYGFHFSTVYNSIASGISIHNFNSSTAYNSASFGNSSDYKTSHTNKIAGVVFADPANGDFSNAMTSNGINAGMEYPEYGILNSNEPVGSAGVNIGMYGGTPLAKRNKPMVSLTCDDDFFYASSEVTATTNCQVTVTDWGAGLSIVNTKILRDGEQIGTAPGNYTIDNISAETVITAQAEYMTVNKPNIQTYTISVVDPTPSITFGGDSLYNTDNIGSASINNIIQLHSADDNASFNTTYEIISLADNSTVDTGSSTLSSIPLTNTLSYGSYKIVATSEIAGYPEFSSTSEHQIEINIPKPVIADGSIVCDKTETVVGDSVNCSVQLDNISSTYGTLAYDWYVAGSKVASGLSAALPLPETAGTKSIEFRAYPNEQPSQYGYASTSILLVKPTYTLSIQNYDSTYLRMNDNGTYYYPVLDNFTVRFAPNTSMLTPVIDVYKDGVSIDHIEPADTNPVTIDLSSYLAGMNAFDNATFTISGSSVEYPQYADIHTVGVVKSPVGLESVTISEYQSQPFDKQTLKFSVVTKDGQAFDKNIHGDMSIQITGTIGGDAIDTGQLDYIDNKTYEIPYENEGNSNLGAKLTYDHSMFTKKYYVDSVSFQAFRNYPVKAEVIRYSAAEAYPPYNANVKLLLDSSTSLGFGRVEWQISKDNATFETLDNMTTGWLSKEFSVPGNYSVRAITHHKANDNITFETEPVSFLIHDTPDAITGIPIRTIRYGIDDLYITTRDESGNDALANVALLKDFKEYIDARNSFWRIYDTATDNLLYELPFKNTTRSNFPDAVGKDIKIVMNVKTTLDRDITGETYLTLDNTTVIDGAVPEYTTRTDYNYITVLCSTTNTCLDPVSDKLFIGERISAGNWKLYRTLDNVTEEIELDRASLTGFNIRDYLGGHFRAEVTYTTTLGRTINGAVEFDVDWLSAIDPIHSQPIEATIVEKSYNYYTPVQTSLSLYFNDRTRVSDVSLVEWFAEDTNAGTTAKIGEGLRLDTTFENVSTYNVYAKIHNKYLKNEEIFTTEPVTIEVLNNPDDITTELDVDPIDQTKYKYYVDLKSLNLEDGEAIKTADLSVTNLANNSSLYSYNSRQAYGYVRLNDTLANIAGTDSNIKFEYNIKTNYGRNIYASTVMSASLPQVLTGLDIKMYSSREGSPLTFKCTLSNGCMEAVKNDLLYGESIGSAVWEVTKDGVPLTVATTNDTATYDNASSGEYTVTANLTTTLGRTLTGSNTYTLDFSTPDTGDTATSDGQTTSISDIDRYFQPDPSFYNISPVEMKYYVLTRGIGYTQLRGYKVEMVTDNGTIENPTRDYITFQSQGTKTITYNLISTDNGTVVRSVDKNLEVRSVEDIFSTDINSITLNIRNVDTTTNTLRIDVDNMTKDFKDMLSNRFVRYTDGYSYGIQVNDIDSGAFDNKTIENRDSAYLTMGSATSGNFEAYFFVNYNGQTYKSPIETVNVENALQSVEIFDVEVSRPSGIYWGTYYAKLTPLIPRKAYSYTYWDAEIVDNDNSSIVAEFGRVTKIKHQFSQPGNYTLKIQAYPTPEKTSAFYTKEVDASMVNELPVIDDLDAKIVTTRLGELMFVGSVTAHDPDSRKLEINWSLCGGDYVKERYNRAIYIFGTSVSDCAGESYVELDDGIGEPVKHIIDVNSLPLEE